MRWALGLTAAAIAVAVSMATTGSAGEKASEKQDVQDFKRDIKLSQQDPIFPDNQKPHQAVKLELKAGVSYQIDLVATQKLVDPYLYLLDEQGKILQRDDDGGGFPNARISFTPKVTGNYTIIATVYTNQLGPMTLTVRSANAKLLLNVSDKLTQNDNHKAYTVKLEKGKVYLIDLVKVNGSLDPFLELYSPDNQKVAEDDDGGGFFNARLIYKATETGQYHIIAKSFMANSTGEFRLTVQEK
jgi:D-arabinose 1-dehydrogenase-like Zn-dependent alcohol dehydrogenase